MAGVPPETTVPADVEKEAIPTQAATTEIVVPETVPQNSSTKIVDPVAEPKTTPEIDESKKTETIAEVNSEQEALIVETNTMSQTETAIDAHAATEEPELAKEPITVPMEQVAAHGINPTPQVEGLIEMECEETSSNVAKTAEKEATTNGLSLLAAYSSDGDTDTDTVHKIDDSDNEDDVVEVPLPANISSGLRQVVALSSGSSASSSDSDSEGEYLTVLRKKIDKRINTEEIDEEDDDEDEDGTRPTHRRQPPKVRGEMTLDELPPIDQLEITVPEDECIELGKVQSIVDQLVLVSVLPNSMLFDLDTVLFLEKGRKVLGQVFDVLGQVADPLYCVRFNSNQQIKDRGINIGDIVYCAPQTEHTQFVILSKLMQVRGSDASWEYDVEPPARFIDYSDDEEEREARWEQRKKRQRERTNSTDSVETVATTTTTNTESTELAPRQRGRRGQRDSRHSYNFQNGNQPQQQQQRQQQQSPAHDTQYNYHPSYNPGSWHSNYYHNYHPPAANFNMMPGMAFPMPQNGYGYMPPPPHPYGMPPPHAMAMAMAPPPHHMYHPHAPPQQPSYNHHQQPPNSGN